MGEDRPGPVEAAERERRVKVVRFVVIVWTLVAILLFLVIALHVACGELTWDPALQKNVNRIAWGTCLP